MIADELAAVAAAITAAGVSATTSPGQLLALVASDPGHTAALVSPPDELRFSLGLAAVDLDVTVTLVTSSPDDVAAFDRLTTALVAAAPAAMPLERVTRETQTVGEVDLPALRWTTARRITHPATHVRSA